MDDQGIDFDTTLKLVRGAQGGDRGSLEQLFARFAPTVRRIVALRMSKSIRDMATYDDVAQDALLKAFQGLDGFEQRSIGTFRNWLSRCVETAIVDHFRHRQAKKRGSGKELVFADAQGDDLTSSIFAGDEPSPSEIVRGRELEQKIEEALLQMDDRYREVIILSKLCGMTFAEVAETLGLEQEGTARQVCFRALQKLRTMLEAS